MRTFAACIYAVHMDGVDIELMKVDRMVAGLTHERWVLYRVRKAEAKTETETVERQEKGIKFLI